MTKTKEERVCIMLEVEFLVSQWLSLVEDTNETAFTDNILEIIQKKTQEL